jgi:hypothetical protein
LLERPAVEKGFRVPSGEPWKISVRNLEKALEGEEGGEELKKGLEEARKLVDEAKEKYGYKYASP